MIPLVALRNGIPGVEVLRRHRLVGLPNCTLRLVLGALHLPHRLLAHSLTDLPYRSARRFGSPAPGISQIHRLEELLAETLNLGAENLAFIVNRRRAPDQGYDGERQSRQ